MDALSRTSRATRGAWLLSGVAWAVRSLLEFARPDYYEPVTGLDWAAVLSYSMAWLLSASAVLLLARDIGSRAVHSVATVFAIAATAAGLANLFEDAFDLAWGGTLYVVGFLVAWIGLILLAIVIWRSRARRLALLPMALFASIALFNVGGGLMVLAAAAWLTAVPVWFDRSRARP